MSKKTDAVKYTFRVSVRPEDPYRLRTFSVTERRRTGTAAELRNCRCADERARVRRLHAHWGLDHHFSDVETPAAVQLAWLERKDDGVWVACAPDMDAGNSYQELRRGVALLKKLGNTVRRHIGAGTVSDGVFADPDVVLAALRHSRDFIEIERFELEGLRYWVETCAELSGRGA